jgi:hypothetical protein
MPRCEISDLLDFRVLLFIPQGLSEWTEIRKVFFFNFLGSRRLLISEAYAEHTFKNL